MERYDPITLTLEDTHEQYTLDFDRDSVRFAERTGFNISDLDSKPMSAAYDLFFYAFRMHHKNVSRQKTDRIIDEYFGGYAGMPVGMMERLGALYGQTFTTLADEGAGKNGKVTVNF